MKKQGKIIGYWHYGVVLTYISVIAASVGMCFSAVQHTWIAVICLLVSGVCDAFDGTVARTRKNRTAEECMFGEQIDSLSDLIAFGVAPAMIGYGMGMDRWYYIPVFVIFILCALIRLAYFNVTEEMRRNSEQLGGGVRKEYEGLPVTAVAIAYPIFWMVASFFWHSEKLYFVSGLIMAFALLLIAVLFVLRFRVPKLKPRGILVAITIVAVLLAVLLTVKGLVFHQLKPPHPSDIPIFKK